MASGQDLRITDVPFSNLPATTATVFINDNGKLRQTDLTTVAKNSELRTMILDAHQNALDDIQNTHDQNTAELELIHDHTLDAFQRASDQHIQTLDDKLNTSSDELSQLIEAGHEKLQDDIKVVDELCAYAATVRETTFEKSAQLMPTVPGNVIIGSVKGASYQKQLSGKNLLKNTATSKEVNGITYTVNTDGSVTANGTATENATIMLMTTRLPNGEYMVSGCPSGGGADTYVLDVQRTIDGANKWTGNHGPGGTAFTIDDSVTDMRVYFYVVKGATVSNLTLYPMITLASETDQTYEPYCGGMASPNPDYPQVIESVGDSGYFDGEWVSGYCLNDGVSAVNTSCAFSKNAISCKENDEIVLKYDGVLSATVASAVVSFYDKSGSYLSQVRASTKWTGKLTVTVPANATSFKFDLRNNANGTLPDLTAKTVVTINGQYATRIKTVGKNLLPNAYTASAYGEDGNYSVYGISYTRQNDGTMLVTGTATANSSYRYAYDTSNQGFLKRYVGKTVTIHIETTDEQIAYSIVLLKNGEQILVKNAMKDAYTFEVPEYDEIRIYLRIASGVTITNATAALQIELGSEATEYKPYTSNTITIPLTEPLRAIGDVKDEICVQNGLYGVLRRVKHNVFDGSEDWSVNHPTNYSYGLVVNDSPAGDSVTVNNVRCDKLIARTQASLYQGRYTNGIAACGESYSKIYVRYDSTITTVDLLKAELAENPITVDYVLATPVFEPFADQTPFYELMAHDEVTNIEIVCGDNLNPSATVMYPSTESGVLLTSAYADSKMSKMFNQKLDEEVALHTQQLANEAYLRNELEVACAANTTALNGYKLFACSQDVFDSMAEYDTSTLYIITE